MLSQSARTTTWHKCVHRPCTHAGPAMQHGMRWVAYVWRRGGPLACFITSNALLLGGGLLALGCAGFAGTPPPVVAGGAEEEGGAQAEGTSSAVGCPAFACLISLDAATSSASQSSQSTVSASLLLAAVRVVLPRCVACVSSSVSGFEQHAGCPCCCWSDEPCSTIQTC